MVFKSVKGALELFPDYITESAGDQEEPHISGTSHQICQQVLSSAI